MAKNTDFIMYGETPSVGTIQTSILTSENAKLDALFLEFQQLAASSDLKRIKKKLYLQANECLKRACRVGIDSDFKQETEAKVKRVMGALQK